MITHAGREIQKYTSAVKVFIIICVHIRVVHLDVLHAHNFAHRFGRDMPPWVELHLASGRFRCPCPREGQILRHYSIMPQQQMHFIPPPRAMIGTEGKTHRRQERRGKCGLQWLSQAPTLRMTGLTMLVTNHHNVFNNTVTNS